MGKSLYIRKMANALEQFKDFTHSHVTIPIHGPIVTPDTILKFLQKCIDESFNSTIVHFDISLKVFVKHSAFAGLLNFNKCFVCSRF